MPGRQSITAPSLKKPKPKPKRQKAKRSLNALAIAEQQNPTRSKIRQSRLGRSEPETTKRKRPEDEEDEHVEDGEGKSKRRKAGDKDLHGNEVEYGSDSSGNEWVVGRVNSNDDSDLDSDEAMGASDEERFEGFGFRGSQAKTSRMKAPLGNADLDLNDEQQDIDLREDSEEAVGLDEESDGLGEDAVDLATMLDAGDDDKDPNQSASQASQSLHGSESDGSSENGSSAEDEESMLSYSGDEDDARDSTKLASLQALVSSMNEQNQTPGRSKAPVDAQESITPSEFGLNSKRKLTITDMIPSVTDPGLRKSLKLLADNDPKPTSKRGGIPKKLDVPLPKRQQDRLDRAAAYKQSKETLNRWIDTVKHNRRAEHLSFPLKDSNATAAPGSQRLLPNSHSLPLTDLESTIKDILKDSGLAAPDGKSEEEQLQAFEELQTNKMPLEEVQARRAELRRARELLFREEIRAKRIKKIKSKSYRKVHRKERERYMQREKDALTAAGVDDSESEKERQDRRRAEERMGARHRESKWAKGVKNSGRAKWDEDAQGGVTEMARRGEDLRRRIEGKLVAGDDDGMVSSESESEEEEEEEDDGEEGDTRDNHRLQNKLLRINEDGNELDPNDKGSRLASMDFMKKAEARRKARNDADAENIRRSLAGEETPSEEEGQEGKGRVSYGPMKLQTSSAMTRQPNRKPDKNEFEEPPGSDDEDGEGQLIAKYEEVDIVVDSSNFQKKADSVKKSSLSDQHKNKRHEAQREEASENPWLVENKKDSNASKRRVQNPNAGAIISNTPAVNTRPPTEKPKPRSALKGARQAEASRQTVRAPSKEPSNPAIPAADNNPASDNDSDDAATTLPFVLRNQDLVRKAFAGDEVVADFEHEKRAAIADEDEKVIDNTLPGWGTWIGPGIGKKAQRRNKGKVLTKIPGVAAEKRQDAKLDRVIINEKRVRKNARYLASSLPHPFETRAQYERSLRLPVGPEWTTKETFQGMTKPRVLMKPGVIAPMSKPII